MSKTNAVREIPNTLKISAYVHCGKCIDELPDGESPKTYQRIQVGWTRLGLQVWCVRHDCNIMHVDFEGYQHPANTDSR